MANDSFESELQKVGLSSPGLATIVAKWALRWSVGLLLLAWITLTFGFFAWLWAIAGAVAALSLYVQIIVHQAIRRRIRQVSRMLDDMQSRSVAPDARSSP